MEKVSIIIQGIYNKKNPGKEVEITPETNLIKDLGFDSLDLAEMTARIEAKTCIDVYKDSFPETVSDINKKLDL